MPCSLLNDHHVIGDVSSLRMQTTDDDHQVAVRLAVQAGNLLVNLRRDLTEAGVDPQELKDHADRTSHEWLTAALADARPHDEVLSEEATEDETRDSSRLEAERVWVIDPLDGTREFSEGRDDWAVHVALAIRGRPVVGAVSLPATDEVFSTASPVAPPAAPPRLRVVVSRSRPPAEALAVTDALGAELIEMGSAGAKTMAILKGVADIYPHSGGQYEWDSCAPVAVASAAGLHCSRLDGSTLVYNEPNPYLPDLLVCRPEHAHLVIEAARSRQPSR